MEAAPDWVSKEILNASERMGDTRAAQWVSSVIFRAIMGHVLSPKVGQGFSPKVGHLFSPKGGH
jgi:hypothetical protein